MTKVTNVECEFYMGSAQHTFNTIGISTLVPYKPEEFIVRCISVVISQLIKTSRVSLLSHNFRILEQLPVQRERKRRKR